MARAIFYTHQTSGACIGVCTWGCTHQMEKTVLFIVRSEDHRKPGNECGFPNPAGLTIFAKSLIADVRQDLKYHPRTYLMQNNRKTHVKQIIRNTEVQNHIQFQRLINSDVILILVVFSMMHSQLIDDQHSHHVETSQLIFLAMAWLPHWWGDSLSHLTLITKFYH